MGDSNFWSVDRLAAEHLLASLQLEPDAELMDIAAAHFARHRQTSHAWAAERVRSNAIRKLESSSATYFHRKSEEWTEGFCSAEQQLIATNPLELLGTEYVKARTKGQILRGLVRHARTSGAA